MNTFTSNFFKFVGFLVVMIPNIKGKAKVYTLIHTHTVIISTIFTPPNIPQCESPWIRAVVSNTCNALRKQKKVRV